MPNVLILGDESYKAAFGEDFYSYCINWMEAESTDLMSSMLDKADVLCFTGGEDVHPLEYLHLPINGPGDYMYDKERDEAEKIWFHEARLREKPMVGICRGAQFLNVMNGGQLVQDMSGHHGSHKAWSYTNVGASLTVSSDHHQMMVPNKFTSELLLFGASSSSIKPDTLISQLPPHPMTEAAGKVDPEVVLYRETRCLCHQPHPEWMEDTSDYWKYFNQTVWRLLEL